MSSRSPSLFSLQVSRVLSRLIFTTLFAWIFFTVLSLLPFFTSYLPLLFLVWIAALCAFLLFSILSNLLFNLFSPFVTIYLSVLACRQLYCYYSAPFFSDPTHLSLGSTGVLSFFLSAFTVLDKYFLPPLFSISSLCLITLNNLFS